MKKTKLTIVSLIEMHENVIAFFGKFESVNINIMSVAEMKKEIFDKVEKLSLSAELDIVLGTLQKIDKEKNKKSSNIDSIYEEAVKQYGPILKKLAE